MSSIVRQLFDRSPVLAMVIVSSLFTLTLGQSEYQCDKYCNKNCEQYSGSELSECMKAHIYCSCSHSNAGIWFGLGTSAFVIILFCFGCCVTSRNWGSSAHTVVAEQVVSTVQNYNSEMGNGAPQTPSAPFIAASPIPQLPYNLSVPEYEQPPSYEESTMNGNANAPAEVIVKR